MTADRLGALIAEHSHVPVIVACTKCKCETLPLRDGRCGFCETELLRRCEWCNEWFLVAPNPRKLFCKPLHKTYAYRHTDKGRAARVRETVARHSRSEWRTCNRCGLLKSIREFSNGRLDCKPCRKIREAVAA